MSKEYLFSDPILIYGDPFVSKNSLIDAKNKYKDAKWVTFYASETPLDKIRMEFGISSWIDSEKKIILIQDLPDRKIVREFLIEIAKTKYEDVKLIVWDSTNNIKPDPSTKELGKTWGEFVDLFSKIDGSRVINSGQEFTYKEEKDCISFVINMFSKYKREISVDNAKLFVGIVGYDRGLIISDIQKMCIVAPKIISSNFILDNAFPTSEESVLFKFSNILDSGSFEDSINSMERFMNSGININVLAEIIAKKTRWQLIATYYWCNGMSFQNIKDKLMEIGSEPSFIWHNNKLSKNEKKETSNKYKGKTGILDYLTKIKKIPSRFFKNDEKTAKRSERLPLYFHAEQVADFLKYKILGDAIQEYQDSHKEKILNRAIKLHLFVLDSYANIRYNSGDNQKSELVAMIKAVTNTKIIF